VSAAVIDDLNRMREIDKQGMIDLVVGFPEQCERAAGLAEEWMPKSGLDGKPDVVVVCGLGGSAIAGDMAAAVYADVLGCAMLTNRDYNLPAFVGSKSLVICESYSGNTEETLSAYDDARRRGSKVVCITSGGKLAENARRDGVDLVLVPGGQPPRSATGYMFVPMMFVFEKLGVARGALDKLSGAIDLLKHAREEWRPESGSSGNRAKQLALDLFGKIPLIYGSVGITGVTAFRWKCQINENAKAHSFANVLPEFNHNEIMGWEGAAAQSGGFAAVFIRDASDTSRIAERIRITSKIIPEDFPVHDVAVEGANALEKLLWGFYLGDFMSVYLAICYGVNPTSIAAIDRLKAELAKLP